MDAKSPKSKRIAGERITFSSNKVADPINSFTRGKEAVPWSGIEGVLSIFFSTNKNIRSFSYYFLDGIFQFFEGPIRYLVKINFPFRVTLNRYSSFPCKIMRSRLPSRRSSLRMTLRIADIEEIGNSPDLGDTFIDDFNFDSFSITLVETQFHIDPKKNSLHTFPWTPPLAILLPPLLSGCPPTSRAVTKKCMGMIDNLK